MYSNNTKKFQVRIIEIDANEFWWHAGLDPAYPLFSIDNTDTRLDTTDAEFVDVIHTNSGYITDIGLSFPFAIGHADFFPNGGSSQAGCGILISGGLTDLIC